MGRAPLRTSFACAVSTELVGFPRWIHPRRASQQEEQEHQQLRKGERRERSCKYPSKPRGEGEVGVTGESLAVDVGRQT